MKHHNINRTKSHFDREIEFLEKRYYDSHKFFRHTLTAISSVIIFVTILISVLSIISSNKIDSAIERMDKRFNELSGKVPSVEINFENRPIDGQIIDLTSPDSVYLLPKIEFINTGSGQSTFPSISLYFSDEVKLLTRNIWLIGQSNDDYYKFLYELNTSQSYTPDLRVIFPGETDYLPEFKFVPLLNISIIKCKIIVFQENIPSISQFKIRLTSK